MSDPVELLSEVIAAQEIKQAFGITGSGMSWRLITALERQGIRFVPVAHEGAAVLMAGAVFKTTGHLALAISIKGPGLANMIPGIAYNSFEANASLSISEAYGSDVPQFRRHKRLDHDGLLRPLIKGLCTLENVERQLPLLLSVSAEEVPGPVHLDLRHGVAAGGGSVNALRPRDIISKSDRILDVVEASKRPLVITGSLATRRQWGALLSQVSVPVLTTASAKGVIDERLPNSAGVFTGDGKALAPEVRLLRESDLIVGLGLRNTEVLTPRSFDVETFVLDEVDQGLSQGFDGNLHIVDAASDLPGSLLACLATKNWGLDLVEDTHTQLARSFSDDAWSPAACFLELNQFSRDHALVLDTGLFCTVGEHLWLAGPERPFLGSGNSRFMGASVPSALGLALTRDLPVVCVAGDGGIRPYVAELKIAVEERLPLCLILMSDGRYGSVAAVAQAYPLTPRAVDVGRPSWLGAVEGIGWAVCKISSRASFEGALRSWSRREPLFLEASFDPARYAAMTRELR